MSTGRQGKYSHYPCSKNDRGPQKGVHFADDTTGLSSSASPPSPLVGAHGQNDTKTASFPALNTGLNIAASVSSTTTKNFGATPAISGFYQGTQQVGTVGTSSTSQQYPYQGFAYQQYPSCVIYQFPIQNSTTNMAATDNYQNTSNPNNGLHFQPQVPDTTYGTIPHTYIPRFDGGTIFAHPLCHVSYAVPPRPILYSIPCQVAVPTMWYQSPVGSASAWHQLSTLYYASPRAPI